LFGELTVQMTCLPCGVRGGDVVGEAGDCDLVEVGGGQCTEDSCGFWGIAFAVFGDGAHHGVDFGVSWIGEVGDVCGVGEERDGAGELAFDSRDGILADAEGEVAAEGELWVVGVGVHVGLRTQGWSSVSMVRHSLLPSMPK